MSFGDFVFACYLNIGKPSSRKQREARIKTCRRGYTSITLRVSIKWKCLNRLEKHTTASNAIAAHEELLALLFMLFYSAIGRQTWWQQGGERR